MELTLEISLYRLTVGGANTSVYNWALTEPLDLRVGLGAVGCLVLVGSTGGTCGHQPSALEAPQ